MKKQTLYSVIFYIEPGSGRKPVQEWLQELPKIEKKKIGRDLLIVQFSWPNIGMPLVRNMKIGFWELRTSVNKREFRVFFTVKQKNIVLLHAIIKKTEKTPPRELELALKRLKTIEQKEMGKK